MAKPKLISHGKLPIFYHKQTRRMFLGELGAFMLSIPLLPSLIPSVAHAATENDFRRAVFMAFGHGCLSLDFEPKNVSYNQVSKNLRVGNLTSAQLGACFPSSYDSLRSKMTILRGLNLSDAWGHTQTTFLCASGRGGPAGDHKAYVSRIPDSADTILSKKIYPNGSPVRILRIGAFGTRTHSFENYNCLDGISSTKALFDLVSKNIVVPDVSGDPTVTPQDLANLRKKKIVDYALTSINKVKKSTSLSASEKPLLDNYAALLSQLQDDIYIKDKPIEPLSKYACSDFIYHSEVGGAQERSKRMCDIVVAAMACGVTKIATMNLPGEHYYVHRVSGANERQLHVDFIKGNVMPTGSYIMKLMDAVEDSNGKSLLENSCVLLSSDMASSVFPNHHGCNFPVVVGGGLNGKLRMGQVIDYQDYTRLLTPFPSQLGSGGYYGGRPYNELLITIMKSFGLTQSDYSFNGSKGFGMYDNRHDGAPGTTVKTYENLRDIYLKEYPDRDRTLDYFYLG